MNAVRKNAERNRYTKAHTAGRNRAAHHPLTTRAVRIAAAFRHLDSVDKKAVALVDALAEKWHITRAQALTRMILLMKRGSDAE